MKSSRRAGPRHCPTSHLRVQGFRIQTLTSTNAEHHVYVHTYIHAYVIMYMGAHVYIYIYISILSTHSESERERERVCVFKIDLWPLGIQSPRRNSRDIWSPEHRPR